MSSASPCLAAAMYARAVWPAKRNGHKKNYHRSSHWAGLSWIILIGCAACTGLA